jgi:hypothetical protein
MFPGSYQTIVIDGKKYLLNDRRNHLMIVPTVTASVTAQSITPVDLLKKSFVMPIIKKNKRKKRVSSSYCIVLAKHKHSNASSASNNSSIVYVCAKKKKTNKRNKNKKSQLLDLVSSPNLSSGDGDEITVVDNPAAILEVESETEVQMQVLPETEDFGQLNNKAKVAQRSCLGQ